MRPGFQFGLFLFDRGDGHVEGVDDLSVRAADSIKPMEPKARGAQSPFIQEYTLDDIGIPNTV